ncbi:hypothetical protein Sinac_6382 [Singulisphaera acidiphila DSM 18658]|uniref:Uncharacterized protein n=1 Tax=Singulisphaera acidiphila (strain ATCC BAA-1392 / DSM 18658 / VKM B-2454 / MOB10) TaxID=886293 RepID=L0DMI3_SINAD|nr:hypothetical protein Sinac_6382 [Singulisphaera acidiphila DSM 18658]
MRMARRIPKALADSLIVRYDETGPEPVTDQPTRATLSLGGDGK